MSAAQKAEAADAKEVTFEYDGDAYTVDRAVFDDLDMMEKLEGGKNVAATRQLLGPDQWAKFREKHKTRDDLNGLYKAFNEVDSGN